MRLALAREIELHRHLLLEHGPRVHHPAPAGEIDERGDHRRAHTRDPEIDAQVHRLAEEHSGDSTEQPLSASLS